MKRFFSILLTMIVAVPILAQTPESRDDAIRAFEEGVEAYNNENFQQAAELFRKANQLKFNWKLLYNIGQSEAAANRNGLALQAFEEYLTRGGDEIPNARKDEVVSEIQRLKLIVGMVEVDGPQGAAVLVDGEQRDVLPLMGPILVSAGIPHEVVVQHNDRQILRQTIRVNGGHTHKLAVADAPESTPAQPSANMQSDEGESDSADISEADGLSDAEPVSSPVPSGARVSPLGPILMGVGGATLAAGLVIGAIALKNGKSLEDKHPSGVPESKENEVDKVNHMALATDILVPAGAAVGVAGFVIWMVQRKKSQPESAVAATPFVLPTGMGVGLTGRF